MFTRTSGGLHAQSFFYNADYTVYIEGRNSESIIDTYDEKYYRAIFSLFIPNKTIKIKVVGSCTDVVAVHKKVVSDDVSNVICFIDNDYNELKFSRIPDFRLINTHGYSWENDFWSIHLCDKTIGVLTNNSLSASKELLLKFNNGVKRLSFLHKVNLSCCMCGVKLLILGAKGGANGIEYDPKSNYLISKAEMKRILIPIKNNANIHEICNLYKNIKSSPVKVIQGHYMEYILLRAMCDIVKKHAPNNTTAPHNTIKNIAFTFFMDNPSAFLTSDSDAHYRSKLQPFAS